MVDGHVAVELPELGRPDPCRALIDLGRSLLERRDAASSPAEREHEQQALDATFRAIDALLAARIDAIAERELTTADLAVWRGWRR